MSKIHNSRLFLEKSAEIFRKKKADSVPIEPGYAKFRPEDHYSSGHCAEFAYCFAQFAKNNGIEPTVSVIYSNQYDKKTNEYLGKVLSHCVVEIDYEGEKITFDINGDQAQEMWLVKVDYIYDCSDMNYKLEFEKIDFEGVKERLAEICLEQEVSFKDENIDTDIDILTSINKKEKSSELTY